MHGLCFSAAAWVWMAGAASWAAALLGLLPRGADAAALTLLHAPMFVFGPMPLFIAGFLLTAGPRWLNAPAVPARSVAIPVAGVVLGWTLAPGLALAAGSIGLPGLSGLAGLAWGLGLAALSWLGLLARLWRLRGAADGGARGHFDLALAGVVVLVAGTGASAGCLALGQPAAVAPIARAGLWCGLVTVFVAASHRMLPFFGDGLPGPWQQRWPRLVPGLMLGAAWWMGLAAAIDAAMAVAASAPTQAPAGPPVNVQGLRGLVGGLGTLAAGVVAGVSSLLVLHWARSPARRQPMMAMLHRALAWWTLGWWALAVAGWPWIGAAWRAALGTAGLHALMMGYLGGTLLAMATRIAATQAGRPVAIDRIARWLEGGLQAAIALRLVAAVGPAFGPALASSAWADLPGQVAAAALPLAALGWAVLASAWGLRHARELGLFTRRW